MDKLTELTRNNLWTAVDDYRRHSYETNVLDDISSDFINRLADDSIKSKRELRDLFRKSQGWDENLQAIVINGTKTLLRSREIETAEAKSTVFEKVS